MKRLWGRDLQQFDCGRWKKLTSSSGWDSVRSRFRFSCVSFTGEKSSVCASCFREATLISSELTHDRFSKTETYLITFSPFFKVYTLWITLGNLQLLKGGLFMLKATNNLEIYLLLHIIYHSLSYFFNPTESLYIRYIYSGFVQLNISVYFCTLLQVLSVLMMLYVSMPKVDLFGPVLCKSSSQNESETWKYFPSEETE